MAINVQCACGKRTAVGDALAGRSIRCPGCGDEIFVVASAPAAGKGGGPKQRAGPAIELSRGQIIGLWVIGILVVVGGAFYLGPVRVWQQWSAMQPKASRDVGDLIVDALKQHMKDEDPDPRTRRRMPSVERNDVSFFQPMAMTMPEKVFFIGKSSQGTFTGHYYPRTGEMDADVSYGGYSVAGMVDIGKPRGTFHLVGRVVNGKREFEIDGKKNVIDPTAH
jgi:hypothetical protein